MDGQGVDTYTFWIVAPPQLTQDLGPPTQTATLKGKFDARRRLPENFSLKEDESNGKKRSSRVPHARSRGQLTGGLTSGIRDRQQWLMTACCSLVPIIASTHSPQGLADGIKEHSPWRPNTMLARSCTGGPVSSRVLQCM